MDEHECNFDLERMKEAVKGPFITIPRGMRGEELREWLREQIAVREKDQE